MYTARSYGFHGRMGSVYIHMYLDFLLFGLCNLHHSFCYLLFRKDQSQNYPDVLQAVCVLLNQDPNIWRVSIISPIATILMRAEMFIKYGTPEICMSTVSFPHGINRNATSENDPVSIHIHTIAGIIILITHVMVINHPKASPHSGNI